MSLRKQRDSFYELVGAFTEYSQPKVSIRHIRRFLTQTTNIKLPDEEKLRLLAIDLEKESFADGWRSIRRIYAYSHKLNPNDWVILHSWGISAVGWLENEPGDTKASAFVFKDAVRALRKSLDLNPDEADILYTLGLAHYFYAGQTDRTHKYLRSGISWFEKTLALNSKAVMAQLYLAHCFHDLAYSYGNDYRKLALSEYLKVDKKELSAKWPAWRCLKLEEQIIMCLAFSNRESESKAAISEFLRELGKLRPDKFGGHDSVGNLDELVRTLTDKIKDSYLRERTKTQIRRFKLESLYTEFMQIS